jgi:hypothetical protein
VLNFANDKMSLSDRKAHTAKTVNESKLTYGAVLPRIRGARVKLRQHGNEVKGNISRVDESSFQVTGRKKWSCDDHQL